MIVQYTPPKPSNQPHTRCYAEKHTLNKQHGIDAPIVFRVICDLRVFCPNDSPTRSDHTQLADVDFDDGSFGEDAEGGVEW